MLNIITSNIGTIAIRVPGWPEADIQRLFEALERWPLDPLFAWTGEDSDPMRGPFKGRAWDFPVHKFEPALGRWVYVYTRPSHPDHPNAVRYTGDFRGHSFGFMLETDNPELIGRLDDLIAKNMAREDYQSAVQALRALGHLQSDPITPCVMEVRL